MKDTYSADGRAVLVGVEMKGARRSWSVQDSLQELGQLALTAGLTVADATYQKLVHPDPSTYVGSGTVEELKSLVAAMDAGYLIFDEELSPGQQRKLEKALGSEVRILDRTRLILDIFSRHAHTREGKLQVELAQYQYLLPRLSGMRADLAQQTGGSMAGPVGLRGPGETQLELDRRQVRRNIQKLKADIEVVRAQRSRRSVQRSESGLPVISLVGYTNAGKSSLLNALTGAGVLVEDKLFATLDPTTRRLSLPGGRQALLTDTVGFIRKLPHDLVAAFRATMEGIQEASLVLHVVDASHPRALDQITAVESVLTSLKVIETPRLVVWNKVDLLPPGVSPPALPASIPDCVAVSAVTGRNLDALLDRTDRMLAGGLVQMDLFIPWASYRTASGLYGQGTILEREETDDGVRMKVSIPAALAARLEAYRKK